jgi:hypothetical protein
MGENIIKKAIACSIKAIPTTIESSKIHPLLGIIVGSNNFLKCINEYQKKEDICRRLKQIKDEKLRKELQEVVECGCKTNTISQHLKA